jgi:DNA helicase II / ATP-dependent DNA helicase PcrA
MDVSHLLDPLNDAQREAVSAAPGPVARAGRRRQRQDARAGAPHRLAHRGRAGVAPGHPRRHLHQQGRRRDARPHRVAAGICRSTTCGWAPSTAWPTGCCACHWREAGLPKASQILDSEDQQRLVKRIIRGAGLDEARWVPREVTWFINAQKGRGPAPEAPQGRRRPDPSPDDQAVRGVRGSLQAVTASSISPSCCCAATSCGRTRRDSSSSTGRASATCWWTSSRTPMRSSTTG